MYVQLASPNLATVGTAGMCQAYTENVFGAPHGHEADAHHGWLDAKFKHQGIPPVDISCPIFFDWYGTVDGVYKNWGHACVWYKGQVYTSPLKGTGHLVYPSIAHIKNAFGLGNYLGWSEDISTKQVIKEDSMHNLSDAEYQDLVNQKSWAVDVQAALATSTDKAITDNISSGPQMNLAVKDLIGWKVQGLQLQKELDQIGKPTELGPGVWKTN